MNTEVVKEIQQYHKTLTQYYHHAGVQAYNNPNWQMPQEMRDEIAHFENKISELKETV